MLYEATSRQEVRLSEFIDLEGKWRWSKVSLDLINLWDMVHVVSLCPSIGDRWVWVVGELSCLGLVIRVLVRV